MYFSTPPLPQKNMLLIRCVCVCVCVCPCVSARLCVFSCMFVWVVDGQLWASVFTYRPLLLLASVWGPISQLCWRSINPDRSIVPPLFTGPDQRLALRYHFQLEKHSWAGMEADLKRLQQPTGGTGRFLRPKKINNGKETCSLLK